METEMDKSWREIDFKSIEIDLKSLYRVPKEWLKRKITIDEAEKKHMVKDKRLGPEPVPFGFQHKTWVHLKAMMKPGDELWEFSNSQGSWKNLAGRAGICIVRQREVVYSLVTLMS
jgi:hypothetical protein